MTLGQMIARVKRQLPSATGETTSSDLDIIFELNHGVDEVNLIAGIYRTDEGTSFNTIAEKQVYSISTIAPNYLAMAKGGLWLYDSDNASKYLYRKTLPWLDQHIRNWRDTDSGLPVWYFADGDNLGFYYKPDAAYTCKLYHLLKSTPMDNNSNFPWWNKNTEMVSMRAFDNAIIAYAVWKLAPAVGDPSKAPDYEQQFMSEVKKATYQVRRRPDMTIDTDYFLRPDVMPSPQIN